MKPCTHRRLRSSKRRRLPCDWIREFDQVIVTGRDINDCERDTFVFVTNMPGVVGCVPRRSHFFCGDDYQWAEPERHAIKVWPLTLPHELHDGKCWFDLRDPRTKVFVIRREEEKPEDIVPLPTSWRTLKETP